MKTILKNLSGLYRTSLETKTSRLRNAGWLTFILVCMAPGSALATVRYVDGNSGAPTPPYTNWAIAAHAIQDAVDAAQTGDEIVVTNGIYATGGRAVGTNVLVNRVAVDKPLTLRSVNGPQFTIIQGYQVPGTTNGDGAIRCVYLVNGTVLAGFILTHGATLTSGDSGDPSHHGGGAWCEGLSAVVSNCVLTVNSAHWWGGGVYGGTLNNCTLTGNSVGYDGGGACAGTLNNCTLTGNSACYGGGACWGTLNNCTLTGNSAAYGGGAACEATLNNCSLTGNSADYGGGACDGTLNNCTVTGNSASSGGGASGGTLNNCLVYYNSPLNYSGSPFNDCTLNHCCTTPLPPGPGNMAEEPQLASPWRLSSSSPCIGRGSAAYASGLDLEGEPWANPPAIGCDEYWSGSVTGALSVAVAAAYTNVEVGFGVEFQAIIGGRANASRWDFGDGSTVSNRPWASHAWAAPGDYVVELRAYNESFPAGVAATVTVRVLAQAHYVALTNASPVPPYTSWATAATNIQDAVDAAPAGGLVLVGSGVYSTGVREVHGMNRVAVTKPVIVQSVNGPQFTVIQGYQVPGTTNGDTAIRCAYMASGASLSGFTLINGATGTNGPDRCGGGLTCESKNATVSDCVLTGNSADGGGGGVFGGTLSNSTISGNTARESGGGALSSILNNCVLTGNSAEVAGGGVFGGTLSNSTLRGNRAGWFGGGAGSSTLNNCILTGNVANYGGGAGSDYGYDLCVLNNCSLSGNSAYSLGGGSYTAQLNHCTVVGNSAHVGGGAVGGIGWPSLTDCIVYFNNADEDPDSANVWGPASWPADSLKYCCTTPLPTGGVGNISDDPQLASVSHLSASSPCRGAGSAAYTSGTDIDGEAWAPQPSIGCDEYHVGAVTGPLSVRIEAAYTNVAAGLPLNLTAYADGRTTASIWEFGDGLTVSNRPCATHAWNRPGEYIVTARAYNESNAEGVSASVSIHVIPQPVYYVSADSTNPVPPFVSWATAATNIQDAVDAADVAPLPPGSVLVLVSNGVYATGGRTLRPNIIDNRVTVDKPLILRSVNGPEVTVVRGYQVPGTTNGDGAVRCVSLCRGASLEGFTLANGATHAVSENPDYNQSGGGGVWCESKSAHVSNCVLAGNAALRGGGAYGGRLTDSILVGNSVFSQYEGDAWGGGADGSTLESCVLSRNSSSWAGGGASSCTLNNCTLTENSAGVVLGASLAFGGGAYGGTLNNCVLTRNSAEFGGGACESALNNCTLIRNSSTSGGGAYDGTLNNCVLTGNSAGYGGGAFEGTLNNCTLIGNSATGPGGGVSYGTLNNCIVYFNTAAEAPNYFSYDPAQLELNYCCTTPMPNSWQQGFGNITNVPLFVEYAGGNLRLQSNSPCINAGLNDYVTSSTDLDGLPRIVSGTVDIGAYEFQGPGSVISYAWLQQYGLPIDGSEDFTDPDRDGMNNWQEWRCLTDPTNALSALRLLSATRDGANVTVRWQSVAGVDYSLERSADLLSSPQFVPVASGIPGQPGTTAFTDTNAPGSGPFFYRVGVGN